VFASQYELGDTAHLRGVVAALLASNYIYAEATATLVSDRLDREHIRFVRFSAVP